MDAGCSFGTRTRTGTGSRADAATGAEVEVEVEAETEGETEALPDSLPLSSYAWFHGNLTREQAEEPLASHAFVGEHVFLVRESVSFSGDYSISFLYVLYTALLSCSMYIL